MSSSGLVCFTATSNSQQRNERPLRIVQPAVQPVSARHTIQLKRTSVRAARRGAARSMAAWRGGAWRGVAGRGDKGVTQIHNLHLLTLTVCNAIGGLTLMRT